MVPPTLVIKLFLENHIFTFDFSLKQAAGGVSYQEICQNFGKMQKFGLCLQDLLKSSPKSLDRILRYCRQMVLVMSTPLPVG